MNTTTDKSESGKWVRGQEAGEGRGEGLVAGKGSMKNRK